MNEIAALSGSDNSCSMFDSSKGGCFNIQSAVVLQGKATLLRYLQDGALQKHTEWIGSMCCRLGRIAHSNAHSIRPNNPPMREHHGSLAPCLRLPLGMVYTGLEVLEAGCDTGEVLAASRSCCYRRPPRARGRRRPTVVAAVERL